jgi:hypothetical protein
MPAITQNVRKTEIRQLPVVEHYRGLIIPIHRTDEEVAEECMQYSGLKLWNFPFSTPDARTLRHHPFKLYSQHQFSMRRRRTPHPRCNDPLIHHITTPSPSWPSPISPALASKHARSTHSFFIYLSKILPTSVALFLG